MQSDKLAGRHIDRDSCTDGQRKDQRSGMIRVMNRWTDRQIHISANG